MSATRNARARGRAVRWCALVLLSAAASCASRDVEQVPQSAEDDAASTITATSPTVAPDAEPVVSDVVVSDVVVSGVVVSSVGSS
jgi:hypothetical protein